MLKILVSCGGGMSSSALTIHMQEEIIKQNLEDKVQVEFMAFPLFALNQDKLDFNIVLVCPHLRYYIQSMIKKNEIKIPVYIIPALLYGSMDIVYLMEDALDLLELTKDTDDMLLKFPEEKIFDVKRNTSHRRWIKNHPPK